MYMYLTDFSMQPISFRDSTAQQRHKCNRYRDIDKFLLANHVDYC